MRDCGAHPNEKARLRRFAQRQLKYFLPGHVLDRTLDLACREAGLT
jgi:hypothetical protein